MMEVKPSIESVDILELENKKYRLVHNPHRILYELCVSGEFEGHIFSGVIARFSHITEFTDFAEQIEQIVNEAKEEI